MINSFEEGFLLGILIGEGHFGGDGKQAQITLRMHIRHEKLFFWLKDKFPSSQLYGPYHHGGRHYYQWMARGKALVQDIIPIISKNYDFFDEHIKLRIKEMCLRYNLDLNIHSF